MPNSIREMTRGASLPRISRRDFVNGLLVASGGFVTGLSAPSRALAVETGGQCGDILGGDSRVLRSGNLPAAFNVAHWLRDNRLKFETAAVSLAPGCDAYQGRFDIADDGGDFDVIVIGTGLAGLSAAFYLLQERPQTRILLLEANDYAGGNAARDAGPPLPVAASTAGAFCATPSGYLHPFYNEIGIDWSKHVITDPRVCYFFDENAPGVKPGYRGWLNDHSLLAPDSTEASPYSPRIIEDLNRTVRAWKYWASVAGGPDDPPDRSSPRYDYLSEMTLADYLTKELHCDPVVTDIYTNYTIDCMGGTAHRVSAHAAISFLSSEYGDKCFTYPGGTSQVASQLVRWLTDDSKARRQAAEIRLNAVALRIDTVDSPGRHDVGVTYFQDEKFHRATARAMIVATQSSSARRLVEHLVDDERKQAWGDFNTVPALVANVAVRSMAPFVESNLAYANYLWGSRYWSNFEVADWTTGNRHDPDRASVLTFYGGITSPPEEFTAERMKLLQTPFADYESSLREDLSRVMRGTKFDFDRDVSAIFVYRWGHSMILPTTRSLFGNVRGHDGRLDRSRAPRRIACAPLGPISFAGQYTEGSPSVESSIGSGHRAAGEVLRDL
jgi:phytoene dehydrogenase-like protein